LLILNKKMKFSMNLIPRDKVDRFGVLTTLFLIFLITFNNISALINQPANDPTTNTILLIVGVWILFNVFGNMYKAMSVDTTIYSINLPNIMLPDWKYCSFCEENSPPRCFHCFTCNKCVLKRHSHCLFLGKCAGHNNQRYYLLFVFYVLLGVGLSNIINRNYFFEVFINNPNLRTIFCVFMPLFAIGLGMISVMDFLVIFANTISMLLLPILFLYFFINFKMALKGLTWFENGKQILIYDLGWRQNLIDIFGKNWLMAIINPFSKLKLNNDGTQFKTNNSTNAQSESASYPINTSNNNLFKRREPERIL